MDSKKFDEAVALLTAAQPTEKQIALVNDRLGDAYFAKGDIENARKVWMQAVAHPVDPSLMGFVQLKLQALPEVAAQEPKAEEAAQ